MLQRNLPFKERHHHYYRISNDVSQFALNVDPTPTCWQAFVSMISVLGLEGLKLSGRTSLQISFGCTGGLSQLALCLFLFCHESG